MTSANDRREAAMKHWLSMLTTSTQGALLRYAGAASPESRPIPAAAHASREAFLAMQTEATRAVLDDAVGAPEEDQEVPLAPDQVYYFLVEAPDGEYPVLRSFRTPKALAARLGAMEGTDAVAWAFYGVHLQFTEGPQRYLYLPDGQTAMQIPKYDGGPAAAVEMDLLTGLPVQSDGYLGAPEMFNKSAAKAQPARPVTQVKPLSVTTVKPPVDEDDDDDDDDDEDEPPRKRPAKPRK